MGVWVVAGVASGVRSLVALTWCRCRAYCIFVSGFALWSWEIEFANRWLDKNCSRAMHSLLAVLVVALLLGIAVGLFLQHRLYVLLRSQHPRALEVLAESSAGVMAFQRYLWRRHYLGLGDAPFNRRAGFIRSYWKTCFLYSLLVIASVIVALGFGR